MLNKLIQDRTVKLLNTPIVEFTGVGKNGDLYGLELEIEGRNVAMDGVPSKNWKRVADGSLRGESIEYVFSTPCDFDEAVSRVNKLFENFEKNDVVLRNSYRCSTHVHLNFGDKTVKQMAAFFILHTILEELLEQYCGDQRAGNLFCISARHNEGQVEELRQAIFHHGNFMNFNDNVRYCAANIAALNKFGTIEIRTMRGADTAKDVIEWIGILNSMYKWSIGNNLSPARLLESLSHKGAVGFLEQFFDQPQINALLGTWPAVKDLRVSLLEGVRLVQMLAYRLDELWDIEYKKPEVAKKAKNPFVDLAQPPAARINVGLPFDEREVRRVRDEGDGIRNAVEVPFGPRLEPRAWFVNNPDHDRVIHPNQEYTYDVVDGCYKAADGTPLRWMKKNGHDLVYGTGLERDINWYYYHYYGIELHEEDDEDDIDPDWDVEPDPEWN